jgi:hypothetical protein
MGRGRHTTESIREKPPTRRIRNRWAERISDAKNSPC